MLNRIYYPQAIVNLTVIIYNYGDTSIKDEFTYLFKPMSVSININSYRQADTCSLTFRYEDVPFDPRLIKAVRATVSIKDQKELKNLTQRDIKITGEDQLFIGFADSSTITLDSSNRTINLELRDLTALAIDTRYDDANLLDANGKRTLKISLAQPLETLLKEILSNVKGLENVPIEDRTGKAIQNVATALPSFTLLNGRQTSDGVNTYVNQNQTYWDVIVGLAEGLGLLIYFELDKLVINSSRFLYQTSSSFVNKTPLTFIYGHNVERLEFNRNLARKKRFNIVVRSHQMRTGQILEASIPKDATSSWLKENNLSGKIVTEEILDSQGRRIERNAPAYVISHPNLTIERMKEVGQGYFEEVIRQNLSGEIESKDMSAVGTDGIEFDITKIKVGRPIVLDITSEDLKYILRYSPTGDKISNADRVRYLISRGYSDNVASSLVQAISRGKEKLKPTFYVSYAYLNFDQSSGFSITIGFVNYIQLGELTDGQLTSG